MTFIGRGFDFYPPPEEDNENESDRFKKRIEKKFKTSWVDDLMWFLVQLVRIPVLVTLTSAPIILVVMKIGEIFAAPYP